MSLYLWLGIEMPYLGFLVGDSPVFGLVLQVLGLLEGFFIPCGGSLSPSQLIPGLQFPLDSLRSMLRVRWNQLCNVIFFG